MFVHHIALFVHHIETFVNTWDVWSSHRQLYIKLSYLSSTLRCRSSHCVACPRYVNPSHWDIVHRLGIVPWRLIFPSRYGVLKSLHKLYSDLRVVVALQCVRCETHHHFHLSEQTKLLLLTCLVSPFKKEYITSAQLHRTVIWGSTLSERLEYASHQP